MNDGVDAAAAAPSATHPRGMARWWPHLLLLAIAVGWGLSISLATVAMSGGRAALEVSLWSALVGLACLSLYLIANRTFPPVTRRHLAFYAVCGLLGTAAPGVLSLAAAAHLPAGVRSVLFALIPIITLVCAAALGRERTGPLRLAGLLLGLAAVVVLLWPGRGAVSPEEIVWILVSIVVAACYALENVYIDVRRPPGLDPVVALWGMTLAAILMLAPIVWLWGAAQAPQLVRPGAFALALAAMSILNVGCYAGYILLIGRAGPVFASQVSYLTPLTGIAWGVVVLHEGVSPAIVVSVAMVLASIALVRPRKQVP